MCLYQARTVMCTCVRGIDCVYVSMILMFDSDSVAFCDCSDNVVFCDFSDIVVFCDCSDSMVFCHCSGSVVFWDCSDSVYVVVCVYLSFD